MEKIKVGIIFGGKSTEHEVSLISSRDIISAIDENKYDIVRIGVLKDGSSYYFPDDSYLINGNDPETIRIDSSKGIPGSFVLGGRSFLCMDKNLPLRLDVAFPVVHGTNGEDGSLQGVLHLAGIPYVGPSILGSAIGMDKDVSLRLLRDSKVPIPNFLVFTKNQINEIEFNSAKEELGLPMFVKPANGGSSVGITKVKNKNDFETAIKEAFKFDDKILLEEAILGKEVRVSVMGNDVPVASIVGEVIPTHEFYDYDAKYIDKDGSTFEIPAKLTDKEANLVKNISIKTYKALCCEGMTRIDGFFTPEHNFILNEINTIPGFSKKSIYPKLWETSGINYQELIDKLLTFALQRQKNNENKIYSI